MHLLQVANLRSNVTKELRGHLHDLHRLELMFVSGGGDRAVQEGDVSGGGWSIVPQAEEPEDTKPTPVRRRRATERR